MSLCPQQPILGALFECDVCCWLMDGNLRVPIVPIVCTWDVCRSPSPRLSVNVSRSMRRSYLSRTVGTRCVCGWGWVEWVGVDECACVCTHG